MHWDRSTQLTRPFPKLFRHFIAFLHGQRLRLAVALLILAITTLLNLAPLAAPKPILDIIIGDAPIPETVLNIAPWLGTMSKEGLLLLIALASAGAALIGVVLQTLGRWTATKVATRTKLTVRRTLYDHVVQLPLHRVYAIKSGGISSILRDDANGVGDLVFQMIYNPFQAVVQLTATLVVLLLVDWRLLLGAVALFPMVWVSNRLWVTRIRPHWRDIRKTRQGIDARTTETFGGMRVVRAFGRRRSETAGYTTDSNFMARQELHNWWWMRSIEAMWSILIPLSTSLLLYFGGWLVLDGQLTVGDLVLFIAFLAAMLGPIATLANSATGFQTSLAGLDRTLDLLDEAPEFDDTPSSKFLRREDVAGRVVLENVHFRYPADYDAGEGDEANKQVIKGVDLDVAAGETVAFVGPSGAGKTTLCNLIARFHDPTEGRVLLDGHDLRDIDVESFRNLLAIVEQDTFLFDGTIAENIAYANRSATMEQIRSAAEQANAADFIDELPFGYRTYVGERGVKLSGGQRQRLTIARAILADPKLLILDEATSNLDTQSERMIQQSLGTLMRGRTSFVIAHRLSTIRDADRIVVIDNGRIAEQGTHDELMQSSGHYQWMVKLQTEGTNASHR
ncbi:MAG: ABC transporter ATP-binding protein [Planctomycetota bacterium]